MLIYNIKRYKVLYLHYNIKHYNMRLRIKEVLKDRKITVVSLAANVGMAQPSMSNIVNGKTMPSLETLEKIAAIIGCPITELFEQPKKDGVHLTCPHCGKIIAVKVE